MGRKESNQTKSKLPFNHNLIGWKSAIIPERYNDNDKTSFIN